MVPEIKPRASRRQGKSSKTEPYPRSPLLLFIQSLSNKSCLPEIVPLGAEAICQLVESGVEVMKHTEHITGDATSEGIAHTFLCKYRVLGIEWELTRRVREGFLQRGSLC